MSFFSRSPYERRRLPKKQFFSGAKKKRVFSGNSAAEPFPVGIALLWMLALGVAFYTLLFSSLHTIDTFRVSGNSDILTSKIEEVGRDFLKQKVWYVFSESNYFVFSEERFEDYLLERLPKLSSVTAEKEFSHTLRVNVSERERILLWCVSESCLFLDEKGCTKNARFAEDPLNYPFLLRIADMSNAQTSEGDCPLASDIPSFVLRLTALFEKDMDIRLSEAPVLTPTRISRDIRFTTEEGWEIRTSANIAPEKIVATLKIFLSQELSPEERAKLRYIDLRTENRVFYSLLPVPEDVMSDDLQEKEGEKDASSSEKPRE